ncbi:MAG: hypothetical protein B7Z37_26595 [Verrucomicrobia bacterium 12-59-8]|nr:MAG: hypothetical protein B7Z37_26595 [Verrucomicrobia bacterium 12-59-8]
MTGYFKRMQDQLRRMGAEVNGTAELQAEVVTPYGPVRIAFWRGDLTAWLLAFPDNWKGNWFGFERWKLPFKLSNLTAGGRSDDEILEQFVTWVSQFFIPTAKGFPTIPETYPSKKPLMLSLRHVPLFVVWPEELTVLTSRTGVAVWLPSWRSNGPGNAGWFRAIELAAGSQESDWVVFVHGLEPDDRFERFGAIDGRRKSAEDTRG